MNEIMEKTYELIDWLEDSDMMKEMERAKVRILNNSQIQELLASGNGLDDEYLLREKKMKLYAYSEYQDYMRCYNQLRYIVMDMNHRYQKVVSDKSCFKR